MALPVDDGDQIPEPTTPPLPMLLGASCTGGQSIPIHVLRAIHHKGDLDTVARWFDAAPTRDIDETLGVLRAKPARRPHAPGAGAQGAREDVERSPRLRFRPPQRRRLACPLVLAVLLQDPNPQQQRPRRSRRHPLAHRPVVDSPKLLSYSYSPREASLKQRVHDRVHGQLLEVRVLLAHADEHDGLARLVRH